MNAAEGEDTESLFTSDVGEDDEWTFAIPVGDKVNIVNVSTGDAADQHNGSFAYWYLTNSPSAERHYIFEADGIGNYTPEYDGTLTMPDEDVTVVLGFVD